MLGPTHVFVITITSIRSFQVFDTVEALTRGGPSKSTYMMVYAMFETVYVRGPNLQVLVDPVLAPIGAVVVNARSALTWATILVKRGGKQYSTPHLAGRDMPHAVGRRGGGGRGGKIKWSKK